jgi:hypothetical protein
MGNDSGIWGFQMVAMRSHILWDVMPYSPMKVSRRFGRQFFLSLQSG